MGTHERPPAFVPDSVGRRSGAAPVFGTRRRTGPDAE